MNKPMWEKGQIFLMEEFQIIHINTPQPRGQHLIPPHLECGPDLVHSPSTEESMERENSNFTGDNWQTQP